MFPILFNIPDFIPFIGGRAIHTYGALVATAFMVGLSWVRYESRRKQISVEKMLDLFFYVVLAAILGSRVLYVIISIPRWWADPLVFVRFWEGGLVFYGGLIGATLTVIAYSLYQKLAFFKVADIFIPGVAIGHSIGRLGCFAAGCCYGRPASADSLFSVIFPHTEHSIAPHTHPVYATQLFESFGALVLFGVLMLLRRRQKFDGEIFLAYIVLYPILRSVIEIFRGDTIRGFIIEGFLSTSQFISLIWVLIAVTLWITVLRGQKT